MSTAGAGIGSYEAREISFDPNGFRLGGFEDSRLSDPSKSEIQKVKQRKTVIENDFRAEFAL